MDIQFSNGTVNVVSYLGYNGGFATEKCQMYRVAVVGLNGYTLHNYTSKNRDSVMARAQQWASNTGFPLKQFREETEVKTKYVEV